MSEYDLGEVVLKVSIDDTDLIRQAVQSGKLAGNEISKSLQEALTRGGLVAGKEARQGIESQLSGGINLTFNTNLSKVYSEVRSLYELTSKRPTIEFQSKGVDEIEKKLLSIYRLKDGLSSSSGSININLTGNSSDPNLRGYFSGLENVIKASSSRKGIIGTVASGISDGFTNEIGFRFSSGLGIGKSTQRITSNLKKYAIEVDKYLFGIEDMTAAAIAEMMRGGSSKQIMSAAAGRMAIKKPMAGFQKMFELAQFNVADIDKHAESPTFKPFFDSLPDSAKVDRKGKPLSASGMLRDSKVRNDLLAYIDAKLEESRPKEFMDGFINPSIMAMSPIKNFIAKIQANRHISDARAKLANGEVDLPGLGEDETGYVQMIGGAMFRKGEGHRQLTNAFEGVFPGQRMLGVANPDSDPGGKAQNKLTEYLFNQIKAAAPSLAGNQEISNTIVNTLTMLTNAIDPSRSSSTVVDALANILAVKDKGLSPEKIGTVSYSMGGSNAKALAEALDMEGINSKVHALAYPDLNFSGRKLPNYQASLVKEDALGFAKNQLKLGDNSNQVMYKAGVLPGPEAHAYQHYFKNPDQVDNFYGHLGLQKPSDTSKIPQYLNKSAAYYETIGSMLQTQSLLKSGDFDYSTPAKAFKASKNIKGVDVFAKVVEGAETLTGADLPGMTTEMKAVKAKLTESLMETYKLLVEKMIEGGASISPTSKPGDLLGYFKHQEQLDTYNSTVDTFKTGKVTKDKGYFAGELDPIKIQQRLVDIDKASTWMRGNIPATSEYKPKILALFADMRTMMTEYINTGKVSESTLAKIQRVEPDQMSEHFSGLMGKNFNDLDAPDIQDLDVTNQSFLDYTLQYKDFIKKIKAQEEEIERKAKELEIAAKKAELAGTLNTLNRKKELEPLAKSFGVETKGLDKKQTIEALLTNDLDEVKDKTHLITQEKAKKKLEDREKLNSNVAALGGATRASVDVLGDIGKAAISSNVAQKVLFAGKESLSALGAVAKVSYGVLEGAENLALDMIPMGRTLKGIGQQVVLPAATFTAATHLLPGGQVIAQGLGSLAQGGMAPLSGSLGEVASSGAANFISHAIPNVMGIQATISGAVTGAITEATATGGAILAQGLATVLGGKVITTTLSNSIAQVIPQLEAKSTPLALPMAREKDLVELQPKPEVKQLAAKVNVEPIQTVLTEVVDDGDELVKSAANEVLSKAKKLSLDIRTLHKTFKKAIKSGDSTEAYKLARAIDDYGNKYQELLEASKADLGSQAKMGTPLGNQINSQKGHIGKARKDAQRYLNLSNNIKSAEPKQVGEEIVDGLVSGVDNNKGAKAGENLGKNVIKGAKDSLEIKSPSKVFQRIGQDIVEGLKEGISSLGYTDSEKQFDTIAGNIAKGLKVGVDGIDELIESMPKLKTALLLGTSAFGLFGVAIPAVMKAGEIAAPFIEAAKAAEQLAVKMSFAEGSTEKASKSIEYAKNFAKKLGTNQNVAINSYAGLLASTKDTALEGETTKQIFEGFTKGGAARQLGKNEMQGVFLAVQQMSDKGQISQEELRGQLAERMSGVMAVAARSRGQSVAEMNRDLKKGVTSEEFLPKLDRQLSAESELALPAAMNSSIAVANRFENSITNIQETLGKGLLPIQNTGLSVLTSGLESLIALTPALLNLGGLLASSWGFGLAKSFLASGLGASLLSVGLRGIGTAALTALPGLVKLGAQFAIFSTAVEVVKAIGFAMADAAGESRKLADEMTTNTKKVSEMRNQFSNPTTKKAQRELEETALIDGTFLSGLSKTYNEDDSIGGKAGYFLRLGVGGAERGIQNLFGDATYAEKKANDIAVATGDIVVGASTHTNQMQMDLINTKSAINQLAEYNKQLDLLQEKRRAKAELNPEDSKGLQALKLEEEQIRKNMEAVSKVSGAQTAQNQTNIDILKKEIEKYEKLAAEPGDNQGRYAASLTALKLELSAAEATQEKFNKTLREGADAFTRFTVQMASAFDKLADGTERIKLSTTAAKTELLDAQLSGDVSKSQAGFIGQKLDTQALQSTLTLTTDAISKMTAIMDTQSSVLKAYGITDQMGKAELTTLGDKVTNPKDKQVISDYAKLQDTKAQKLQIENELKSSQVEAQNQVKETTKQIGEFYKGIIEQTKALEVETKASKNKVAMMKAETKLRSALMGFQETFVTSYVESLVGFLKLLNKPLEDAIAAQGQLLNNANTLTSTLLQGQELRDGLDNGQSFSGPAATKLEGSISGQLDASGQNGADMPVGPNGEMKSYHTGTVIQKGTAGNNGNYVVVKFKGDDGVEYEATYSHVGSTLKIGDRVQAGQDIGKFDASGRTFGAHNSIDINSPGNNGSFQRSQETAGARRQADLLVKGITQGSGGFATKKSNFSGGAASGGNVSAEALVGAVLSILEAPSRQGRVDVAQVIANRAGSNFGGYGSSVRDQAFASGQFQPFFSQTYGIGKNDIRDQSSAIAALKKAGFNQEQAVSALNSFFADISNPAMVNDSASKVGGRQYFKGVSEYGNMRSDDFLRNRGENFFHHEDSDTIHRRQTPIGNVFGGARGASVGSPGIDNSGNFAVLDSASSQAVANNIQQAANIKEQLAASGQLDALQAQQAKNKLTQQFKTGLAESSYAVTQQERAAEDKASSLGFTTPQKQRDIDVRSANREFYDSNKDLIKQLEELKSARDDLKASIAVIKAGGFQGADQLQDQLPMLTQGLKTTEQNVTKIEGLVGTAAKQRDAKIADINQKFQIADASRVAGVESQLAGLVATRQKLEADLSGLVYTPGVDLIGDKSKSEIEEKKAAHEVDLRTLEEQLRTGELTADEYERMLAIKRLILSQEISINEAQAARDKEALKRQIDNKLLESNQALNVVKADQLSAIGRVGESDQLKQSNKKVTLGVELANGMVENDEFARSTNASAEVVDKLRNNLIEINQLKISIADTEFTRENARTKREIDNRVFDSDQALTSGKADYLASIGKSGASEELRQQMQIGALGAELSKGMAEIDEFARSTNVSAETVAKLRNNLIELNQVKLDTLRAQFNPFQEIANTAKTAVGGFFKDMLMGTKSVKDAFKDMVGNILSKVADLAVNALMNDLFSGGKGNKGGGGGLFSNLLGGLFGGGKESGGGFIGDALGGGESSGGGIGGLFSGVIGLFASQGYVGKDVPNYAKGNLAKAFDKERIESGGKTPKLAVINESEIILSAAQSEKFKRLGLDKQLNSSIRNYASGNLEFSSPSGSTTVNVPVTVNTTNGEKPQINGEALSAAVRSAVNVELLRQKRNGGIL